MQLTEFCMFCYFEEVAASEIDTAKDNVAVSFSNYKEERTCAAISKYRDGIILACLVRETKCKIVSWSNGGKLGTRSSSWHENEKCGYWAAKILIGALCSRDSDKLNWSKNDPYTSYEMGCYYWKSNAREEGIYMYFCYLCMRVYSNMALLLARLLISTQSRMST